MRIVWTLVMFMEFANERRETADQRPFPSPEGLRQRNGAAAYSAACLLDCASAIPFKPATKSDSIGTKSSASPAASAIA